jgi:hypothetical protein
VVDAPTEHVSGERCLAQMFWRKDIDFSLFKVRQTEDFKTMQDTLTGAKLVEYGMIPARLHNDLKLIKNVSFGIAICVSARVYKDGLSPVDALAAVVDSGGLKAIYFDIP